MPSNSETRWPEWLRPGDLIGIVAPASPPDRERLECGISWLETLGYRCRVYGDPYGHPGYLAGEDLHRAAALMQALSDNEVRAVLPARGGYGCARLVSLIDWDRLRTLPPKMFIGYSDVTALHLALCQSCGWTTFHGPHAMELVNGCTVADAVSAEQFRGVLSGCAQREIFSHCWPVADDWPVLRTGSCVGPMIGGNLSVLTSLLGTAFEVDTRGKILFLEEVHEAPYRVDRCLCQLRLSGKLDDAVGVLLGHFTDCEARDGTQSATLQEVLLHYLQGLNCPVVGGFPAGHQQPNLTIPFGALVELDAVHGRLRCVRK